jgi:hypothetical protein
MLRNDGVDRGEAAEVLPAGQHVRFLMERGDHKILVQSLTGRGYALVEAQDLSQEIPDPPGTPTIFRENNTSHPPVVQTTVPKLLQFPKPVFTPSKWPMEPSVPPPKPSKPVELEPGLRLVHLEG